MQDVLSVVHVSVLTAVASRHYINLPAEITWSVVVELELMMGELWNVRYHVTLNRLTRQRIREFL